VKYKTDKGAEDKKKEKGKHAAGVVRNAIEALRTLCHTFYGWLRTKRVIVGTAPARSVRRMEMKKHKTQSRLRHQSRRKLKLNYL